MKKILSFLTMAMVSLAMWAELPSNLYLIGSACSTGWDLNSAPTMTQTSDGVFTWSGSLTASGEFKFLPERSWTTSYTCQFATSGNQTVESGTTYALYARGEHEGNDNKFVVSTTGNYDVTVDLNTMTMVCTLQEQLVDLKITGNACSCGWSASNALSLKSLGGGKYTITTDLAVGKNFRFLTSSNWYPTYTTATANEPVSEGVYSLTYFESQPAGEPAFLVAVGGNYTIDVDLTAYTMTMTLNQPKLYMVGSSLTAADGNWDYAKSDELTYNESSKLFNWTGSLYALTESGSTAEFKFLKSNTAWDGYVSATSSTITIESGTTYGIRDSSGNPDSKFVVPETATYAVTVSLDDMTMKIEKTTTTGLVTTVADSADVTVVDGGVAVATASPVTVNVYATSGCRVASVEVDGVATVSLPTGVYLVAVGEKVTKVAVR